MKEIVTPETAESASSWHPLKSKSCILWLTDLDLRLTRMGGNELVSLGTPDLSFPCPVQEFFEEEAPGRCLQAHHLALGCMRGSFVFLGGPKTFLAHVEPLFDLSGDLIGTIGLAMDITESRESPDRIPYALAPEVRA